MNKELIEKLTAIREDLEALWDSEEINLASADEEPVMFQRRIKLKDPKELAEVLKQTAPRMQRNYEELRPYMTTGQQSRVDNLGVVLANDTRAAEQFALGLLSDLDALTHTVKWLGAIADHMGCPVSELLRYKNAETKTAAQSEDERLT